MTGERIPAQRNSKKDPARRAALANANAVNVAAWSSPADGARVGGDWCEVVSISERVLGVTIGDVAGHGAPVAPTMTIVRGVVLRAMRAGQVPSDVLSVANGVAAARCEGAVITGIVELFDRMLRTLTFANAGHPPPLLLTGAGPRFLEHRPADIPLGIFPAYRSVDYQITLPADSLAVFYTDGITEHARDPIRGEEELIEAARFAHARPKLDAARAIAQRVFATGRGGDDAAAIALRTPAGPR